jgi:hypothetical protein
MNTSMIFQLIWIRVPEMQLKLNAMASIKGHWKYGKDNKRKAIHINL